MAIAVLTSCSSGETANETLPPVSSSAAPTSDTLQPLGPPDLPMPMEARQQSEAGAQAFLRYYMQLYSAAQASMNADYLDQFSQDCATCDRIIEEIRQDAATGYSYRGGQISVDYLDSSPVKGSVVEAVLSIRQSPLTVIDSTGQPIPSLIFDERTSSGSGALLGWDETTNSWVLNQWDVN
ncbi:hypothetical protein GCU67_10095 [Modestobacter muralis]|uniref:DUF6318 domain-containing protein n=1 Tax=Modestobacter muralis TaxID=1608614 RepID=A0A6P0H6G8_9ACTN|nr:hypothetical protein [Modestobacter muralis]NEN51408.1 hypothetical protein [Modestobacter muralis]